MRISKKFAENFSLEWIEAWNSHDIDRVMKLYSDDIQFHSPGIKIVMKEDICFLIGASALKRYWESALDMLPNLYFEYKNVFVSSNAVSLIYSNERGQEVVETFVFNKDNLVTISIAAKSVAQI